MKRLSPALTMIVLILAVFALTNCEKAEQVTPEVSGKAEATVAATPPSKNQKTTSGLLDHEWFIEDIDGQGVVDNSPANVVFTDDGKMGGNDSCNRIMAFYEGGKADGKLQIEAAGYKKMPCAEALKKQEERLLEILYKTNSYTINDTKLILKTDDGKVITARRR